MADRSDQCEYCSGLVDEAERLVTVYRHRKAKHFIFEQVPARVCLICGERYFSPCVVRKMDGLMRARRCNAPTVAVPVIALTALG